MSNRGWNIWSVVSFGILVLILGGVLWHIHLRESKKPRGVFERSGILGYTIEVRPLEGPTEYFYLSLNRIMGDDYDYYLDRGSVVLKEDSVIFNHSRVDWFNQSEKWVQMREVVSYEYFVWDRTLVVTNRSREVL